MGKIYTPPTRPESHINHLVFLAGSIEEDKAINWQSIVCDELVKIPNLTIFNPRRANWDSSWVQKIENTQFKEQVDWELDYIETVDTVIFYFDPNTKSPITLMELGIVSQVPLTESRGYQQKVIVCCPEGFWRKGNVDILCSRMHNDVIQVPTLDDLLTTSIQYLTIKTKKHWYGY